MIENSTNWYIKSGGISKQLIAQKFIDLRFYGPLLFLEIIILCIILKVLFAKNIPVTRGVNIYKNIQAVISTE